jgi:hypothetical protein
MSGRPTCTTTSGRRGHPRKDPLHRVDPRRLTQELLGRPNAMLLWNRREESAFPLAHHWPVG